MMLKNLTILIKKCKIIDYWVSSKLYKTIISTIPVCLVDVCWFRLMIASVIISYNTII